MRWILGLFCFTFLALTIVHFADSREVTENRDSFSNKREEREREEQEKREEREREEREEREKQEREKENEWKKREREKQKERKKREQERTDDCKIDIQGIGDGYPLILNTSDHSNFIYPQESSIIRFHPNDKITLGCITTATCICKSRHLVQEATFLQYYDINLLNCLSSAQPSVREVPNSRFGYENLYKKFQIGFSVGQSFIPTIEIYYSLETYSTAFVRITLPKSLGFKQQDSSQLIMKDDYCCNGLSPSKLYSIVNQRQTFDDLLLCHGHSSSKGCNYLTENRNFYLVPTLLASKSNFVYTLASSTAFYYLNTAPQWKSIRDGNWNKIEKHVSRMSAQLNRDLVELTGVHKNLKLADTLDGNVRKAIYMHNDYSNCIKRFPVPLYFWKLVYDPSSNNGVVFVTVNNPYIKRGMSYLMCKRPMQSFNGQSPAGWDPENIELGYSYMCEIEDFIITSGINLVDKLYKNE